MRAIVLVGVGGGCRLGLGCDLDSGGCSRLLIGMLAIGGGRFDLYKGSRACGSEAGLGNGELFSVLAVRAGKLNRGVLISSLLVAMKSGKGDVSFDALSRACVVSGGRGHVLSCSERRDGTPGSDEGVEMVGCRGGNGGTTSMLPCLLPARLLSDGCRLLLAVDGLEESSVPWRILDLGAPAEAERFPSCLNDLRLCASDIRPFTSCRDCSFFFVLLDGNGGNAQS